MQRLKGFLGFESKIGIEMGRGMSLLMLPLESTTARSAFVSEDLLSAGGNPENSKRVGWAGGRVLGTCAGMSLARTKNLALVKRN